MRELVYYIAVSIDGRIAAPDGSFDAFPLEGDHMETLLTEYADALPTHVLASMGLEAPRTRFNTVIQGWNSYAVAHSVGITRPYAHLREFVATRTKDTTDPAVTFTRDALSTVQKLKQDDGLDIYLCGGGNLAGHLLPEIDRLILKRNPIILGAGISLFGGVTGRPASFHPVHARRFSSGVVIEEYERAR
ncbi:dihydrofolate reductase family protein [uncultured Arthrobacter sp.]|uniref:dihydrofolate reductase family protein n=1 Tax=uncultured Arthrobacter sp. TaxID=114050 RepID=UPI002601D991|nr:dihydrofolate reductase family protein [uncultured Arthrobacter sp.]